MTINRTDLEEACSHGYRTLEDIAEQFGVTRERIRQLTKAYGIDRGSYSVEHWDEMSYASVIRLSPRSRWPRNSRQQWKAELGYCARNGCNQMAATGKKQCAFHLKDLRERVVRFGYTEKRKALAIAMGLCRSCLKVPPKEGIQLCIACARKAVEAHQRYLMKDGNRAKQNAISLASYYRRKANKRQEVQQSKNRVGRLVKRLVTKIRRENGNE